MFCQNEIYSNHFKMQSQSSRFFFYYLSVVVKVWFLISYLKEISVLAFPTETDVDGYPDEKLVQLRMQGANPAVPNTIVCTGFDLKTGDQFWIKQIEAVVVRSNIAMNLCGCNTVSAPGNPCSYPLVDRSLLFSWYRYSPPFRFDSTFFPTGFNVGGDSQIQTLFIEVRYGSTIPSPDYSNGFDLHITRVRPYYVASIYSVLVPGVIPPNTPFIYFDTCVTVPPHPNDIRLIAYRTNAQTYGVLGSGYVKSKKTGEIKELGRGNPTFPQAFLVPAISVQLNPGDFIMVRCVFNSATGFVGSTKASQACIFNIMWITPYFVPAITTGSFLKGTCTAEQKASFPESSTKLLPDNDILRKHAEYGTESGIVTIDSTHTMNLDLETFLDIYP